MIGSLSWTGCLVRKLSWQFSRLGDFLEENLLAYDSQDLISKLLPSGCHIFPYKLVTRISCSIKVNNFYLINLSVFAKEDLFNIIAKMFY